MLRNPSTEGVEILRTKRFPFDAIACIVGLQMVTGADDKKIWRSDVMEAPEFLSRSL
jgi:hypothetical protein